VLTAYNGRIWLNILDGKGPLRGSFSSREAAIAVGRTHAASAQTTHVIHNEVGEIVQTDSYERLARLTSSPV
jgi:hypothetical protein